MRAKQSKGGLFLERPFQPLRFFAELFDAVFRGGVGGEHVGPFRGFIGCRKDPQMLVAALAGGLLLSLADYLARVLVYPNQLPAGLLAALVGGLYFLWGLSRHGRG